VIGFVQLGPWTPHRWTPKVFYPRFLRQSHTVPEGYGNKMVNLEDVAQLVIRQAASTTTTTAAQSTTISCDTGNGYDGRISLRISAIFVILVGSSFGKKTVSLENTDLTIKHRRGLSSLCKSSQGRWRARMGLFHSQVLWLRGYHCHRIYTRKYEAGC